MAIMDVRLKYRDAAGQEHVVPVDNVLYTIGRSHTNNLCLPFMFVSREHARITQQGDQCVIQDLKSKHGTYLNGTKIDSAVLQPGDRLALGGPNGIEIVVGGRDVFDSLLKYPAGMSEAGAGKGFKDLALLLEAFQALNSTFVLEELLNLVVDSAVALSSADRGFILLKQPDETLKLAVGRGRQRQSLELGSFAISRRVPEETVHTQRTIIIQDIELEADGHETTRQLGLKSICSIPLRLNPVAENPHLTTDFRPEVIGVLYLDSWSATSPFNGEVLNSLESLALEASLAIEKARMYKESLERKKMVEELSIAREIQQQLLPTREYAQPWVQLCSVNIPCREIGGDYFDYLDLSENSVGVVIADVSGKGTPAALLTSMLQGVFYATAMLDEPICTTLEKVNRALLRRKMENRFVTLFYGILSKDGSFEYSSAGHNPPILIQKKGVRRLEVGGLLLGLFEATYQSEKVALEPEDVLVLFTDGVTEAINSAGEEFGEERLIELIQLHRQQSATEITQILMDNLHRFSQGVPLPDDVTLMVVKVPPAG
jgi:serine phosphatase RsbU (regulator of sigma subunit)